jgi:hypothetical protein
MIVQEKAQDAYMDILEKIKNNLSDDLRKPQYQGHPNIYWGHCYIATEVLYYLWGKQRGYKPQVLKLDNGGTHWFLRKGCHIVDPTQKQFDMPVDYSKGKGCGFLTKMPSKRAVILLNRMNHEKNN